MNDSAPRVPGRTGRSARRPDLAGLRARAGRAPRPHALARELREAVRRPRHATAVQDTALWAVLVLPAVIGAVSPLEPDSPRWWPQIIGIAGMAAVIAVHRAWPLAALIVGISLITLHGNFVFAMPVLAYLTGLRWRRTRPVLWGFAVVLVGGAALNLVRGLEVTEWFPSSVWLVLLGVLPWLMGRYWRQYQELVRAGWERAERLEREQRIIAERERLRERARIAQDMHDSLGHELALIAVRAGALQVAPGLDDGHRSAAAELRAGAAEATERLREIIGVLREDPAGPSAGECEAGTADAPTQPAREGIGALVERARASGVSVRLIEDDRAGDGRTTTGTGYDAVLEAAPMVGLAAHRVVQEAITNAAKHAPGAPITVHLTQRGAGAGADADVGGPGGETIEVTVVNGPPPKGPPLLPSGGGRGLTGLAERVRLVGGALHAGPAPDGGFRVTAHLPAGSPGPAGPPPPVPASPAGSALRATFGLAAVPQGAPRDTDPADTPDGPDGPDANRASESTRHLQRVRRRARRDLITTIAVPSALLAALGAVMVGHHIFVTLNSVLDPADYRALNIGASRDTIEPVLPPMEAGAAGLVIEAVPEPRGADCRYYSPQANLLGTSRIYRLCFTGGRLTAKDSYSTSVLSQRLDAQQNAQEDAP